MPKRRSKEWKAMCGTLRTDRETGREESSTETERARDAISSEAMAALDERITVAKSDLARLRAMPFSVTNSDRIERCERRLLAALRLKLSAKPAAPADDDPAPPDPPPALDPAAAHRARFFDEPLLPSKRRRR